MADPAETSGALSAEQLTADRINKLKDGVLYRGSVTFADGYVSKYGHPENQSGSDIKASVRTLTKDRGHKPVELEMYTVAEHGA